MRAAIVLFGFLLSFSTVVAYAGLPAILDNPGEPGFPVPVPPPPADDGAAAAGGGMGGGLPNGMLNGTSPLPGENGTVPVDGGSASVSGTSSGGSTAAVGGADAPGDGLPGAAPPNGTLPGTFSVYLYGALGLVLVLALVVVLVVARRNRASRDLPKRLKRF